jgi:DNA (cytosine-5)-methyltransferase 1
MAEALGWGLIERPSGTLVAGSNRTGGIAPLDGGAGARETYNRAKREGKWLQPGSWADGRGGNRRLYDPKTEPATVCIGHDDCGWAWVRPATTIVGSFRPDIVAAPGYRVTTEDGPRQDAPGSIKVTLAEAAVLQGFPPDYPWQGSKTKRWQQVGNAIPPPLAEAILRQLV